MSFSKASQALVASAFLIAFGLLLYYYFSMTYYYSNLYYVSIVSVGVGMIGLFYAFRLFMVERRPGFFANAKKLDEEEAIALT